MLHAPVCCFHAITDVCREDEETSQHYQVAVLRLLQVTIPVIYPLSYARLDVFDSANHPCFLGFAFQQFISGQSSLLPLRLTLNFLDIHLLS